MFRMPRFEEAGQVVDDCSPEQREHPVHPVILSKKVRSGPVIPSSGPWWFLFYPEHPVRG